MKTLFFLFVFLNASLLMAQDTIWKSPRQYSGFECMLAQNGDTVVAGFYEGGKTESLRQYSKYRIEGNYERYYENGKLMWRKNIKNNREEGICAYYDQQGEKVAEFFYHGGVVADTLFLSGKTTVVLGRMTYFSHVYGGMQREFEFEEPELQREIAYINYPVILVQIKDTASKPEIVQRFQTDTFGNFLLCLNEGEYGFFPADYDMKQITTGLFCPPHQIGSSFQSGWNMEAPLKITSPSLKHFHLHFHSVGYAP